MQDYTVHDWFTSWLTIHRPNIAPLTYLGYCDTVEKYITPALGYRSLRELTPLDCQLLVSEVSARFPRAAQLVYAVLHVSLAAAVDLGALEASPMARLRAPRHRAAAIDYWSLPELQQFLSAARSDRFYIAWVLLVCCGLRRGELIGLRWQDLDLNSRTLRVRSQLIPVRGQGLVRSAPKSQAGQRDIGLPDDCCQLLADHRRHVAAQCLAHGHRINGDSPVVCLPDGSPVHPTTLSRAFRALSDGCGLRRIHLHGLRHSMATLALSSGVDLRCLQSILGHSSCQVTADVYVHVLDSTRRAAISSVYSLAVR